MKFKIFKGVLQTIPAGEISQHKLYTFTYKGSCWWYIGHSWLNLLKIVLTEWKADRHLIG